LDHQAHKKRGLPACRWVIFLLLGCLLLHCGGSSGSSGTDDGDSEQTTRSFRIGVAPIPRNFPGSTQDWLDMFSKLGAVAEIVTAQNGWRDSVGGSGDIPEFIALIGDQKDTYGYIPFFGINFFEQGGTYDPDLATNGNPTNDWSNDEAKQLKKTFPHVCFRQHYSLRPAIILGSRVHLEKTLMNLVTNAVEAIVDEGTVIVSIPRRPWDGSAAPDWAWLWFGARSGTTTGIST
jgi:hypothetical protein